MGISITITGDNVASVIGDMEDLVNGGHLDVAGFDNAPDADESPEQPAPVKQRRTRKPKAAAPAQQDAKAATLPASPAPVAAAPNPAPAAHSPSAPAYTPGSDAAQAGTPMGPEAVAPGGKVFEAVKVYNDKHGMEAAIALLAKYGAGMVRQIKPADYEAVIAACAA